MNILVFGLEYYPIIGGGGSYVDYLVKGLANEGKDKIRLVTSGSKNSKKNIYPNLEVLRFKIFNDLYYQRGDIIDGINCLIEQIREFKPGIIHAQHSLPMLMAQAANIVFSIPLVGTHHKTPDHKETINPIDGKRSLFKYVSFSPISQFISSSAVFRSSLIRVGINPQSIDLIYPGVDRNKFSRQSEKKIDNLKKKLGIKNQDLVFLSPVKIRKRKGLEFLANALNGFQIPNKQIKVIITGLPQTADEEEAILKFKNKCNPAILVNHWEFSDEEMPILYSLSDITLLLSEAEGLGMVLLEAMSCGCPVIGSNVIGINEVIQNKKNGELVDYGNLKELRKSITRCLDPKISEKYKNSGEISLTDKFNTKVQAQEHLEVYQKLATRKKTSAGGILYRRNKKSLEVYLAVHDKYGFILPKGGRKPGETLIETAIREVAEETGYKVSNPEYALPAINYSLLENNETFDKEVYFFVFKISKQIKKGSLKLDPGEKIKRKARWVEIKEAKKLLAHKTEIEIIEKLKQVENFLP